MRNIILFIFIASLFSSCKNESRPVRVVESGRTPFDNMFMQRAYPTGKIKTDALTKAIQFKKSMSGVSQRSNTAIWEFAGPENIGGRITDLEIPIDQSQVYYAGAASGGIFKTTNGGSTWNPIFDGLETSAIGDIEISKSNTDLLWVGTGEPNAGGGSLAYSGNGVYSSSDGGTNWTNHGLNNVGSISKVLIDPNDNNTIFVGAMGALFDNDTNRGVYRSTDNGSSWDQVLFVSDSTGIIDMVNHPSNSNILYAAAWERIRRPQFRSYGGETSGIYRSTNGGDTWTELTSGLPSLGSDKGRISIAIAPSNPNVLYARYSDAIGFIQGVYRTNNGGDTWFQVNSSQLTGVSFHWWFRGLFVDPTDEDVLYNVDFIVEKSTNGGNSWFEVFPDVHVDQHAMAFNTQNNNEVLLGNDGGVYKSTNGGASSTKFFNLPITQFYRFHVDPQNSNKIYGGSQDNNTMRTVTGGLDDWETIFGGDGFQPLVDPTNTNTIYALSQRGNLGKSTDNGANFSLAINGITLADRNNWDTPITFDPFDSQTLYYGTQRVYRSTNGAQLWQPISGDLTNGSGNGNNTFGTITTIDVSRLNRNIIIAGTDDSNVWITQDGGVSWDNISPNLPNLWTTKVLADRMDQNTLYVTFSGYRYATNSSHVFKSVDAGASWFDIGIGLPDIPVNDIVKDINGNLYVATDVGVFTSEDEGAEWVAMDINIPNVPVTDLHIDESAELLYAATYGRSAYKADISDEMMTNTSNQFLEDLMVYPNPATDFITISIPGETSKLNVSIYDNYGRIIDQRRIDKSNTKINVSHLHTGIYYLKLFDKNNSVVKSIVIK